MNMLVVQREMVSVWEEVTENLHTCFNFNCGPNIYEL